MKRFKKAALVFTITVSVLVILIIAFISPLTKYFIQKYDVKYTGRQITLDWVYVNPFTGYIHFKNLKVYESKSDSIFLSAGSLSAGFSLRKYLSHNVQLNNATLEHFFIRVVRDHKRMNFQDIIDKFSSGDTTAAQDQHKPATHVNLGELKILDAEIHYTDKQIPFDYFIRKGDFQTPGKRWNQDTMAFTYSFLSGPTRGSMEGQFDVNFKTSDYLITDRIVSFDLKPMEQYIRDLANYGNLRAILDADLTAKGNFHDAENIVAHGHVGITDFHLGKYPGDDYMAFDRLRVAVTELSPVNNKYILDSITLLHPYVKYERYDHTDNMETMFAKKETANRTAKGNPEKLNIIIAIGQYIKALATNFFRSSYKVNYLAITKGDVTYNDFSLSEEFSTGVHGLTITADSVSKSRRRVTVALHTGVKPYGNMAVKLNIDPNDSTYYHLDYHMENVPVSMFNPYTVTYTSFPIDRGTIEVKGAWNVRDGFIDSRNHLVIVDPRATKRVRGKDKKWLPLPLIFAFIRERGNVIDYEIPITGNLKNPKFHLHDAVMHLLANIFIKPATTPYRFEVKNIEKVIEKSLLVKWPLMGSTLLPSQDKFLSETAEFLSQNTGASIVVEPVEYSTKEKEYITFFEAKKKYFLATNHMDAQAFTGKDSITVNSMAIRDNSFIRYLNAREKDPLVFTLQEKCTRLVGQKIIENALKRLYKNRQDAFASYFKEQQVTSRVKIQPHKNIIPFDGFSYYEINYKGEIPPALKKAYEKMSELNAEKPREKYRKEHKKALVADGKVAAPSH